MSRGWQLASRLLLRSTEHASVAAFDASCFPLTSTAAPRPTQLSVVSSDSRDGESALSAAIGLARTQALSRLGDAEDAQAEEGVRHADAVVPALSRLDCQSGGPAFAARAPPRHFSL